MEQSVLSATMTNVNSRVMPNTPKLTRGFSKVQANQEIVNETRTQIENNYKNLNELNEMNYLNKFLNNELTCYSFMLPDLNKFDDYKFKEYLQNDLIEMPTQFNLTESGHLNWWTENKWENVCRPLYPMITSGDGNCLLHAASLAMWGLHDRYLILRKALNSTLKLIKEDNSSPLWRRWKWEQMCQNRKYGLIYDRSEWAVEWQSLLKLSSYQPRVANNQQTTPCSSSKQQSSSNSNLPQNETNNSHNASSSSISTSSIKSNTNRQQHDISNNNNACYFESLEEFHVFLLANILQRPIIIVSDTMLHDLNGEPLSPIPFGGIYLPFECELSKCHRYPLVLAYDSAHFSALVLMDEDKCDVDNCMMYENDQENWMDNDNEKILSNEEINQINKKLQLKTPYSIIPIQYSNKELLPIHFAYDPGEDYDWSKFPMQSSCMSANSSNDNMSVSSSNNNNNNNNSNNSNKPQAVASPNLAECNIEMSRSETMFIIQKYLDICKLDLYEPAPLSTRRSNQVFNSNGMCASIYTIQVPEPVAVGDGAKSLKSNKSTGKLQKFFANLFKKNPSNDHNHLPKSPKQPSTDNTDNKTSPFSSKLRKSLRNSYTPSPFPTSSKGGSTLTSISTNKQLDPTPKLKITQQSSAIALNPSTVFHKVQAYKNWQGLFHALNNENSFLGVKLNLAKPPKFKQVINNYIESARQRLEMIKQQHRAQLMQQQQQQQMYVNQQQAQQQRQYQQQRHMQAKDHYESQRQMPSHHDYNNHNHPHQTSNRRAQLSPNEQQMHDTRDTANHRNTTNCPDCNSNSDRMCQRCCPNLNNGNKVRANVKVQNIQYVNESDEEEEEEREEYSMVQHL